jgi:hypothetical protein
MAGCTILFDDATVVIPLGTPLAARSRRRAMPDPSLSERVEILEQKVEALEVLPARVAGVEIQILQLRGEMRDGFSALGDRISAVEARLREEIRAGDEETRRYMRVLHEELISSA